MINMDLDWCSYYVTDSKFGQVFPGDESFTDRFSKKYNFVAEHIAWMDQVHGTNIEYVDIDGEKNVVFPETDGIWTDHGNLMLITKTADCVPILLWNEHAGIIAAIHCGWKGFLSGIIESFSKTCEEMSWDTDNFSVFLGPHLRVENFEVRQDFIDQVPSEKRKYIQNKSDGNYFDITKGVISTLNEIGINNITDSGINTYNNPDFFSYRSWTHTPEDRRPESYNTFANAIIIK